MDKRNKFPRWMNHFYANLFGYFWLPCPICGEMTGGHEWRTDLPNSAVMIEFNRGVGVCPNCHDKAKEINMISGLD